MTRLLNKIDKVLLISSVIMFLFGLFMIFDASSMKAFANGLPETYYFSRQILFLGLSLLGTIVIIQIPTKKYKKYFLLIIVCIFALLLLLFPFGIEVNGARSWFNLKFFTIQPSEFAKIAAILVMSIFYRYTYKKLNNFWTAIIPLGICALMVFLTFLQPDAGTALIIFTIAVSLFYMAPILKEYKLKATLLGLGAIVVMGVFILIIKGNFLSGMQSARFNFLKPCTRYQENTGYQVCNGYIAINNGKLISISPGNSKQKYLYLPEAYTDFIFPIIVEEFGLITGIIIILFYILIIYRVILVGKRSNNVQNQMICFGVAILLFSHVVINLVGVLGILPLTGVPLPFLSYGGSFALTVSAGLALVQRISIENYDELKRKVLD